MKCASEMTLKEFRALPQITETPIICRSLVLLPTNRIHDSGFAIIEFVPLDESSVPIGRIAGHSDVIHINGIGGYGRTHKLLIKPIDWSIDCLKESKLLRLFAHRNIVIDEIAYSSFEIFTKEE